MNPMLKEVTKQQQFLLGRHGSPGGKEPAARSGDLVVRQRGGVTWKDKRIMGSDGAVN
jgi:hypothetical protein